MSRLVSLILGWLILIISGVLFMTLNNNMIVGDPLGLFVDFSLIAVMGWSYSVMYQQKYPIEAVSTVYIVETFLLIIFKDDLGEGFLIESMTLFIVLGVIFIVLGPKLAKAITISVAPLQKYFQDIGLNLSVPVIVGIIGFAITCMCLVAQ